jgi:hypothetical protein
MTVLCSPIAGRIVGARGVRGPLVVGGRGLGAGSLMRVSLSAGTYLGVLLVAYCVFGPGFGAVNPPITTPPCRACLQAKPGWPPPWQRRAAKSA